MCQGVRAEKIDTIGTTIFEELDIRLCSGDSYEGITDSGTFIDTIIQNGQCIMRTLNVTVFPTPEEGFERVCDLFEVPGFYSFVTQTAAGCDSFITVEIVRPQEDIITGATICEGDSLEWNDTVYFESTFEDIEKTDDNGCTFFDRLRLTVQPLAECATSVSNEEQESSLFSVHPNPATDFLYVNSSITTSANRLSIDIIDTNGQLILQSVMPSSGGRIDVANLDTGLYILRIQEGTHSVITQSFIKI